MMLRFTLSLFTLAAFTAAAAAQDGFAPLFNGKDLTGWKTVGGNAQFYAEDNILVAETNDEINQTYLVTEKSFGNFIVKLEFKYDSHVDSGFQFRGVMHDKNVWGYQAQISADNNGVLYDEGEKNDWLVNIKDEELKKKTDSLYKADDWNELEVQCVGPSLKSKLNGTQVCDLVDIQYNEGFFGIQIHESKTKGKLRIKNIRIKEFPATPWIPIYGDRQFGSFEVKPVGKWEFNQDENFIRARTEPGQPKDGILVSKDVYKDFAVKVSFKMEHGNSGLYFRAAEVDKDYWLKGFQCEIAENAAVNAALWEVQGRGWVKRNEPVSGAATKKGDWNDIATVAVGDHLVTFLNGKTVINIDDPKCAKEGKVGLQLHGGGNQGCLFRDFYVMPLNDEAVKLIREK
ncbi:MAG: DUF1080 domain-containing protein [Planctomycetaceae bacterium]|nr:DUF1080 domain-containing protein [Planctomycetaceae bacterium]